MFKNLSALAGAIASSTIIATAASAQVATIQNIESFPLEIEPPFTTFEAVQPTLVTLVTNQAITITASPPMPDGATEPPGTQLESYIRHNTVEVPHDTPLSINTVGEAVVEVRMITNRSEPYPAGEYVYDVLLTIAPQ